MTLTAINVLLDPDAATVEKARATNARLREDYPGGFALDANHAPHVTMLQRFVRTADLDQVAKAVADVLRTEQSMNWESKATGYYDLAYQNLGLVGIVVEPTFTIPTVNANMPTTPGRRARASLSEEPMQLARAPVRGACKEHPGIGVPQHARAQIHRVGRHGTSAVNAPRAQSP